MKYLFLGVIGILLVTGCTVSQEQPSKLVDTYCDIAKPILLDKSEIPLLTQETKRQILVHNKTYKQKCLNARIAAESLRKKLHGDFARNIGTTRQLVSRLALSMELNCSHALV